MSFRGGGTAGGRAPNKAGPEYVRHIPKFLQKYEHLMEKREGQRLVRSGNDGDGGDCGGSNPSDAAASGRPGYPAGEEEDDVTFEEQIRGATIVYDERDPSCVPPSSADVATVPSKASSLKEEGNAAFAKGDFKRAIRLFSEAIHADPRNSILYSNRAAAHASSKQFTESLADARKALELQPGWAKAYSRIAAAHMGLKQYEEAMEAYQQGLKSDPQNATCAEGLKQAEEKLQRQEEKEAKEGRHTFRKRKAGAVQQQQQKRQGSTAELGKTQQQKRPLKDEPAGEVKEKGCRDSRASERKGPLLSFDDV